ncbi:MAG: putative toxin-antitoxin system toxin component, PIN family [Bacteroidales bacterium]|nr:putative toxin-antitoxin system toxin component, PIN family [Bacteroidales bacterium]
MSDRPIKIILDTNVWISFLIGQKTSAVVRKLLTSRNVSIVMTGILQSEILAVASRPKFARYFPPEAGEFLLGFLRNRGDYYQIDNIPRRCRDPKDDYLLELAHVSNADLLVTGDKDLTEMHQFGKCTIMTIEELEKRL